MGLRSAFAQGLGRACAWGLTMLAHRNASQLPGRVALAADPHIMASLAHKLTHGTIVVCGTNGKTTTTNIVASAAEKSGACVLCNRAGANMAPGVVAALLPKSSADWAIIEADELSTIQILPALRPKYLVLLNLFRDQLDRAGEIDRVQDVIVRALAASPETTLVACGDDPLVMGVARRASEAGTSVLSFGIAQDLGLAPDRVPEARFCQVCGAELRYSYRTYAQLGAFACPRCDFSRPELDIFATECKVDQHGVSFALAGKLASSKFDTKVHANFGGIYMVYNLMAAFIAARLAGVTPEQFQQALDVYNPQNGRLQHFTIGGREVVLNLAKNPTGFNQNLSLMSADPRKKAVLICINDNYNDGKDVSWLWDVDFERLATSEDDVSQCFVGGHRANDMQVRLKYAGRTSTICTQVSEALEALDTHDAGAADKQPLYVLTNYSALWPAKAELERLQAAEGRAGVSRKDGLSTQRANPAGKGGVLHEPSVESCSPFSRASQLVRRLWQHAGFASSHGVAKHCAPD